MTEQMELVPEPVAEPPPAEPSELDVIEERVAKGIAWLTEHDPSGAFHLWFSSGLTDRSPMPAHAAEGDDTRERWTAYYKARVVWERLWSKMQRLQRKEQGA